MIEKIKEELLAARKENNKVKVSILRLVVSEYELEINRGNKPVVENIIRKIVQSNNDTIALGRDTNAQKLVELLSVENGILLSFLPRYLSKEEIQNHLHETKFGDNFNQAMGTAIRYFKDNNLPVEPKTVREVLETMLVDS